MIKLKDILKEIKITGSTPNEFLKIFLDIAAKKYPDSSWRMQGNNELWSVESDPDADEACIIGWSIKLPMIEPQTNGKSFYVGVTLHNAYTQEYKGILGEAIKIHTKNLLQQHKDSLPALFLATDDLSDGTWDYIADKYGLTLITEDNWDDYVVNAEEDQDALEELP